MLNFLEIIANILGVVGPIAATIGSFGAWISTRRGRQEAAQREAFLASRVSIGLTDGKRTKMSQMSLARGSMTRGEFQGILRLLIAGGRYSLPYLVEMFLDGGKWDQALEGKINSLMVQMDPEELDKFTIGVYDVVVD